MSFRLVNGKGHLQFISPLLAKCFSEWNPFAIGHTDRVPPTLNGGGGSEETI